MSPTVLNAHWPFGDCTMYKLKSISGPIQIWTWMFTVFVSACINAWFVMAGWAVKPFFSCFLFKKNCFSVKGVFLHTQIGCRHALLLATNGSHFSAVLLPVFFHFSIQCFQSGPQFCGGFFVFLGVFFSFNEYFYQV